MCEHVCAFLLVCDFGYFMCICLCSVCMFLCGYLCLIDVSGQLRGQSVNDGSQQAT